MIKKYPAIKGLSWHREQHYSFFIPMDWHRFVWQDDRQGVVYGPDVNDPLTSFSVDLKDLGTRVTTDDLEVLSEGFFGSIGQLPCVTLESHKQKISGQVLELEAIYTFCDEQTTRKCWKRVFYHVTRQITMTAQGATTHTYDYWLPIFFEAMMTANVHSQKPTIDFWA